MEFTNSAVDELNIDGGNRDNSTLDKVSAGGCHLDIPISNHLSLMVEVGSKWTMSMSRVTSDGVLSEAIPAAFRQSTAVSWAMLAMVSTLGKQDNGIEQLRHQAMVTWNYSTCLLTSYTTIADNGSTAVQKGSTPSQFAFEVTNSILTLNGGATSGSMLTEYNYTENYPQFADDEYHLQSYSPAVDAAMPWHTDQNMPFGMGGLRADMGACGENAGWGGEAAPSGSATIANISDSPKIKET